jgi:hypothetical protein
MKKDVLSFLWCNLVAFPVLRGIRLVPIESHALAERVACRHTLYISHMYNDGKNYAINGLMKGQAVSGKLFTQPLAKLAREPFILEDG